MTKDDAEAVRWYRMAAEQGDAQRSVLSRLSYANGKGVTKDDAEAARWLRMAADKGDPKAQFNLGVG